MRNDNEVYPPKKLRSQINNDYYGNHMTLNEVLRKYRKYDPADIKKVLCLCDPDGEPSRIPQWLAEEWNDTCRKINPKAWRDRK